MSLYLAKIEATLSAYKTDVVFDVVVGFEMVSDTSLPAISGFRRKVANVAENIVKVGFVDCFVSSQVVVQFGRPRELQSAFRAGVLRKCAKMCAENMTAYIFAAQRRVLAAVTTEQTIFGNMHLVSELLVATQ